ncbi:hypothetical protein [Desulfogranum japonicum]|uniref:hypothetical protein n=1 Tax=Desulfogranum japonicum TaxID=231447 RepID=UPI000555091A|nr:hypothetical protein [Desulfogranum japonicum]
MDNIVEELQKVLPLKPVTTVGDVVVVAGKDPEFITYAMILAIERDTTRKNEWWHVTMQLLGIPLQKVTWTLRTPQFTGEETFTMGGKARFIQALQFDFDIPPEGPKPEIPQGESKKSPVALRIVK